LAEKEKENVGNGSMAKIPAQVLLAQNQVLPLVDGGNISPDVTSDVISYRRNDVPHGNEDQIAENAENEPINDRGTPGICQSGRLCQPSKKAV
jgi:hypothetical protein